MTAVATLVRAPFQPLLVEERWDKTLLEEAASLIGYRPQALAEAEQTRKRSLDENIFARALEAVNIQPFTLRSVQVYKALMLKKAHKGESLPITQYMHKSGNHGMLKGQTVVHALGWPAWLGSIAVSGFCLAAHFAGYADGWGWD